MSPHALPSGVRRLKDGRWKIRIYAVCFKTGLAKETQRIFSNTMTLAEVLAEREIVKRHIEEGEDPLPNKHLTFYAYAEQWLRVKAEHIRASTAEHYLQILHRHVLPTIGPIIISRFTRRDVQAWVSTVQRARMKDGRPYSRHTTVGWWRIFCQFVRDASADCGVPDPIVRVQAPKGPPGLRRQRKTLTTHELGALLSAVRIDFPHRYAEIYILALTGMRPGELYALRWGDLDENRARLIIRSAHRRGVVGLTKTDAPREAVVTREGLRLLRLHRREMIEAQHPGLESGLIFPAKNGSYRGPESLHKPLRDVSKSLGLEVRAGPLILRRTFNTLMLESGVDRIVLRSMMGHSDEEMTERYAGVSVESKRRAVVALEALTQEG